MKTTFYKSKYLLMDFLIYIILCDLVIGIGYIFIVEYAGYNRFVLLIFILISIAISLFIASLLFLFPQTFISKIYFSKEGIRWLIYKKTIELVLWEDIKDIKVEYKLNKKCVVLLLNRKLLGHRENEFYFNIDKSNVQILYHFCKIDFLNAKIKKIIESKNYKLFGKIN
jgi:hypothetical protein